MQSEIAYEVQNFLYHEARLLDERRFNEWLDMFAEDIRYWMPVRGNRYPKSSKAVMVMEPDTYIEDDIAQDHEMAFFDETKKTLSGRVARLETGMAWAEDPAVENAAPDHQRPGRTGRSRLGAPRVFQLHRVSQQGRSRIRILSGLATGHARRADDGLKIAKRKIVLDMNVLLNKNLAIFF